MNAIKEKLEAMNGHKPTKAEFKAACKLLKSEAKRRIAKPGIMDVPGRWSTLRVIREIWKSARYILKVRKNQTRAFRIAEKMRRDLIRKHGRGAA